MKITGFTIIKNALLNDYPVVEAITSILPVVDEMIVLLGDSEDDTEQLIRNIASDKIRIHRSVWDPAIRKGGEILAVETNKAFDLVPADSDWAFYIQGDEVVHEKYHEAIRQAAQQYKDDKQVEGLLFNYLHFYGTYDYVGDSRRWYHKEIRIIRNDKTIRSYKDAQGFRKHGEKLNVKQISAYIYHYGWVKTPQQMLRKNKHLSQYWSQEHTYKEDLTNEVFDFSDFDPLEKFTGTHPQVIQSRIAKHNISTALDISKKKFSLKGRLLYWFEKKPVYAYSIFGIIKSFEGRNFRNDKLHALNNWPALLEQIKAGDPKWLARSISLVENEAAGYEDLLQSLPNNEQVTIIGITGPPGAGKSTLTDALIGELVQAQKKWLFCVDPSSPFNMGALLGDRIRMSEWYNHPQVFIRSLATRGSLGGLHPKIIEITELLKAAAFDYILVETVGVGQSEVEIAGMADITMVVLVPEAGDEVQTMKAGLMEIADIFVVNKADRPDADTFYRNLKGMLQPAFHATAINVPVIKTVASQKKGIQELYDAIGLQLQQERSMDKKNRLLAEKAFHLLQKHRMKDINKADLLAAIQKEKVTNIYSFVRRFY